MARIFQRLTPHIAANPVKLVIEWQKVIERLEEEIARIGATTADLTFNNSGAGGASGTVFNGSSAKTVSYNTVGAASSGHNHAGVYQPVGSYLTGNQTITLSGDVTGSGETAITATLANTAVTPGSYTNANITVDSKGRITSAASGSAGSGISDGDYGDISVSGGGTVLSIDADTVGPTELIDTAVTPGSYTNASITVDQQGRVTAAASGERVRTVPVSADFTLDNAGTASISDVTDGVKLTVPTVASQIRFARYTAGPPATPYSVIIRAEPVSPYSGGGLYQRCLIARNSSNGRIVIYGDYNNGQHLVQRWSAYGTFSANSLAATTAYHMARQPWIRMTNDGTNLVFARSYDGNEWFDFHTEPLSTYLTAAGGSCDQVGFGTMMNNLGSSSVAVFQSFEIG